MLCVNLYSTGYSRRLLNRIIYFWSLKDVNKKIFSVSPCDSVTCQNEGTCVVEAGLAVCYCKGDYSGATCSG